MKIGEDQMKQVIFLSVMLVILSSLLLLPVMAQSLPSQTPTDGTVPPAAAADKRDAGSTHASQAQGDQDPPSELPANGSPSLGPEDAPVEIVVFSDFECPHCARIEPLLRQIHELWPKEVRVVVKDFPLPSHRSARLAAEAAAGAAAQGCYWPMRERLFQFFSDREGPLTRDDLSSIAAESGLDLFELDFGLDTGEFAGTVDRDLSDGAAAGVSSTPSLFIDGRLWKGERTVRALRPVIELLLAAKGHRLVRQVTPVSGRTGTQGTPHNPEDMSPPSEARNLHLAGTTDTTLTWDPPADAGDPYADVYYDVLRSDISSDFSSASCLLTDGAGLTMTDSDPLPPSVSVRFYLVRSRTRWGSELGTYSNGTPRTGSICMADAGMVCASSDECYSGCCSNWGFCSDTNTDFENCGTCGNDCRSLPNVDFMAFIECASGSCVITPDVCLFGYQHCTSNPQDGCESYLWTDVSNCGSCGNDCWNIPNAASVSCVDGGCVVDACQAGYDFCDESHTSCCSTIRITPSAN